MDPKHRAIMERAFSTTTEAAIALGVSPRTVNRWMSGDRKMPRAYLLTAAIVAERARLSERMYDLSLITGDAEMDAFNFNLHTRYMGLDNALARIIQETA